MGKLCGCPAVEREPRKLETRAPSSLAVIKLLALGAVDMVVFLDA